MVRHATAVWNGSGKEGNGHLTTQSNVLSQTQYSFNTRFTDVVGTNPEELIAAAHAGCFTMKVSFLLNEAGFTADSLQTKCEVTLENGAITKSHLAIEGKVPGVDDQKFQDIVQNAAQNCIISKLFAVPISSEAKLA